MHDMRDSNLQSWAPTLIRLIVGIVFLVHGSQKLFGFGFHGVAGFFTKAGIPLPAISAVVVTLVEFLGGAALVLGLLTRWAAILLAIDMLGAIVFVHYKGGFFLPAGYEFALTLLVVNLALALWGAGPLSVDRLLSKRRP
ncbi:MAG TPA: DoxX family protein [Terriglobales bacterium]